MELLNSKLNEHELQVTYTRWLELQHPHTFEIAYAIPNGGHRHYAVAKKLKAEGVKAGIPDYHIPVPRGKFHGMYIEFKVNNNKPTKIQKEKIKRLKEEGYCVHVCYCLEEAIDATNMYLDGHADY